MPSAGRISTYTSGWPRNQNRCCHSSGEPPGVRQQLLPTTSPDGRKKLVPKCRSSSSMTAAAVSGGNASRPRIDAMKYDQTVSGIRIIDMPGARRLNTVATMLRPLIVNDAMKSAMLSSQIVCPMCEPGTAEATALSGGYAVHPAAAAPPSRRTTRAAPAPTASAIQYDSMFRNGNAMSRAPTCSGTR